MKLIKVMKLLMSVFPRDRGPNPSDSWEDVKFAEIVSDIFSDVSDEEVKLAKRRIWLRVSKVMKRRAKSRVFRWYPALALASLVLVGVLVIKVFQSSENVVNYGGVEVKFSVKGSLKVENLSNGTVKIRAGSDDEFTVKVEEGSRVWITVNRQVYYLNKPGIYRVSRGQVFSEMENGRIALKPQSDVREKGEKSTVSTGGTSGKKVSEKSVRKGSQQLVSGEEKSVKVRTRDEVIMNDGKIYRCNIKKKDGDFLVIELGTGEIKKLKLSSVRQMKFNVR